MTEKKKGRPTDKPKPTRIGIRLDNSTLEKLEDYCQKKGLSKSEVIRQAIEEKIK